jgi:hypothetical protein
MKKVLMGLAILPFLAGVAVAGQPLNDRQMDQVTAGFLGIGLAEAEGLVGESGIVVTTTATLGQVANIATATMGEASSRLWKSISAAQSSTITSTYNPAPIPGGFVASP